MENRTSPQQQIFDEVFKTSLGLGYATYDYLPASKATLPFVFIGEQFDQDVANKSTITGNVQQTLHIHGDRKQRGKLTTMIDNLRTEFRKIKHTENFYVTVKSMNGQVLIDNSTGLSHGILEVEFTFN